MTINVMVKIDYEAVGAYLLDRSAETFKDVPLDCESRDQKFMLFKEWSQVLNNHVERLMDESLEDPDPELTAILLTHQTWGVVRSMRISEHIAYVGVENNHPRYYLPLIIIEEMH